MKQAKTIQEADELYKGSFPKSKGLIEFLLIGFPDKVVLDFYNKSKGRKIIVIDKKENVKESIGGDYYLKYE